jgi:hypothetical protein
MQLIIPWYIAPLVLGMDFALAFWLYRMVSRAVRAAALPPKSGDKVRRATGLALGSWLLLALIVSRSAPLLDAAGNGVVPVTIPLFALVTLGLALGLLAFSETWRRVVDAISADSLISVQFYRVIGAIFILLYSIGSLPRQFALSAGWGDVAVGLLAPLVALAVRRQVRGAQPIALGWNILGLTDLVVAVGLGTGYLLLALQPGLQAPPGAPAMTFFPLVLVPTFAVPLGFILHIYSIRRTLRDRRPILEGIAKESIAPRRAGVTSH